MKLLGFLVGFAFIGVPIGIIVEFYEWFMIGVYYRRRKYAIPVVVSETGLKDLKEFIESKEYIMAFKKKSQIYMTKEKEVPKTVQQTKKETPVEKWDSCCFWLYSLYILIFNNFSSKSILI